ncbi:MAG: peptidylprolyl isomerase [Raoultibacter sp.]
MARIQKPLYTPRYVPSGDEIAVIETNKGTIRVELFGKDAPQTVGNFIELASKGFYDKLNFHGRVEGDVVVGGCPVTRALSAQRVRMAVREQLRGIHPGIGDAGYVIKDEWATNAKNHHSEGTISLARKSGADSGSCQIFFSLADHPEYDEMFTAFGHVIDGIEAVRALRIGDEITKVTIEGAHDLPDDALLPQTIQVRGEVEEDKQDIPNPDYVAMEALGKILGKKASV